MDINLQGNYDRTDLTAPGQFLVQAKSFRFQVTNNPGPENENFRRRLIIHQPSNMDYPQVTIWSKNYNKPSKIKFRHVVSNKQECDYERRQRKFNVVKESLTQK